MEKQVTRLEQERDEWEKKYEVRFSISVSVDLFLFVFSPHSIMNADDDDDDFQEMNEKYKASKLELDSLVQSMEGL